ncbi:glutathione S-transferase 1-like [Armigeres subalbatus]|uniref:glutathione S-transferase 1-like n=1 Tax=Armigeres subalbatus TaxID=124917 RepID=UPI002ED6AFEE
MEQHECELFDTHQFRTNSLLAVMDFYYLPGSAPCRAVMMVAETVGVELNYKLTNLLNGDHLKPEFLKLNPQHCLPTLVDGDFVLWESRAIALYLVEQYGKDDRLYPKEVRKRAVVNQRLFFDATVLYCRFAEAFYPAMKLPAKDSRELQKLDQAVAMLEVFLEGKEFVAGGDGLTVADISTLATITTFDVADYDLERYPNVYSWYKRVSGLTPGWRKNRRGAMQAILYRKFFQVYYPKYFTNVERELGESEAIELLNFLEQFLDGITYLTGEVISPIDRQVTQVIGKIQQQGISISQYSNVLTWASNIGGLQLK